MVEEEVALPAGQEFDGVDAVEVRIIGGDVAVTAAPGPARVDAEVIHGPPLGVGVVDGVLRIVHQPERQIGVSFNVRVAAAISMTLPPDIPITIRTVSADVFAAGTTSGASIATVSGSITATGLQGDISLRTVSGDIEAEGLAGRTTLNTVSGSVTVTREGDGEVTARSVSGDLTLNLLGVPQLRAATVSGDVTIGLPHGAAFSLEAASVSGRLDTTFPRDGFTFERRRLRGRAGDGGPDLVVRTTSGDVAVLRRQPAEVLAVAE